METKKRTVYCRKVKAVHKYTKETRTYGSIREAAKDTGATETCVGKCCRKVDSRVSAKGWVFTYND